MEPPSDPLTLGPDFFPFLNQFQQHPKAPYVHPRAISFRDAAHQDNWINYLDDARDRDTIINFYRTKKDGKSTWIGFCSCERINWVQYQDDWKTEPWHCSTIAVIQDQKKGNTWSYTIRILHHTQSPTRASRAFFEDSNEISSFGFERTRRRTSGSGTQSTARMKDRTSASSTHSAKSRPGLKWEILNGKTKTIHELRTVLNSH